MKPVIHLDQGGSAQGSKYLGTFDDFDAIVAAFPSANFGDSARAENSQGTKWGPAWLTGDFYPEGTYYWNGSEWDSDVEEIIEALDVLTKVHLFTAGKNTLQANPALNATVVMDGTQNAIGTNITYLANQWTVTQNGAVELNAHLALYNNATAVGLTVRWYDVTAGQYVGEESHGSFAGSLLRWQPKATHNVVLTSAQVPRVYELRVNNITGASGFGIDSVGTFATVRQTTLAGVPGTGDMTKSVYDPEDNGVVNNSEALNGQGAAFYLDRANHTGEEQTSDIADNAITNPKLSNMANSTIKGRTTAGTGDPEDLTATQVRSILNVEDGADNTPSATESIEGKAEIATQTEVNAGTDDSRFVTPLKLQTKIQNLIDRLTNWHPPSAASYTVGAGATLSLTDDGEKYKFGLENGQNDTILKNICLYDHYSMLDYDGSDVDVWVQWEVNSGVVAGRTVRLEFNYQFAESGDDWEDGPVSTIAVTQTLTGATLGHVYEFFLGTMSGGAGAIVLGTNLTRLGSHGSDSYSGTYYVAGLRFEKG